MKKYWTILRLAWEEEFTYRLNFILWRVRVVLRLFMTFFLWRAVFAGQRTAFGYTANEITTYIFLIFITSAIVVSSPSADKVGQDISNGDLSNYLVKPFSYLRRAFTVDLASKLLNLSFAAVEITLLFAFLRPQINLGVSLISALSFVLLLLVALMINFYLNLITRFSAFWAPEDMWPFAFLLSILIEVLGGAIFPLDVLPQTVQTVLQFTPFPYLIYYPIAAFLGKITGVMLLKIILKSFIWVLLLHLAVEYLWKKGLQSYAAEGK